MTHAVVDSLDHLLVMAITPANEQKLVQVPQLVAVVQKVRGDHDKLPSVDQGYMGEDMADAAREHSSALAVVQLTAAKRGCVLLPCRWVVE
jgi:hypothetical protein